jgi:hypothetical protein
VEIVTIDSLRRAIMEILKAAFKEGGPFLYALTGTKSLPEDLQLKNQQQPVGTKKPTKKSKKKE